MSDLIGELIAEVFEALFQLMKSPFRGRSRNKKSVPKELQSHTR